MVSNLGIRDISTGRLVFYDIASWTQGECRPGRVVEPMQELNKGPLQTRLQTLGAVPTIWPPADRAENRSYGGWADRHGPSGALLDARVASGSCKYRAGNP